MQEVFEWIDSHQQELIEEFQQFLRIPSVYCNDDMEFCAQWVVNKIEELGYEGQLSPTDGGYAPVVWAELKQPGSEHTFSCYGHYDVQPVEPVDQWTSPPFGAEIHDGKIIARGTQDDKCGVMGFIHAVKAFQKVNGSLPLNLRFVFEGEEEIGSPRYGKWVETHKEQLWADGECIMDGACLKGTNQPPIQPLWLSGFLCVELTCKTTKTDFYSAESQWAPSAAWRLVWALASMKDEKENITIDGWYEDYIQPSDTDWVNMKKSSFNEEALKEKFGVDKLLNGIKKPEEIYYARHYTPTMSINGLISGYTGEGNSTRVPCTATAKVDFRLKGGMEPEKQLEKVKRHLKNRGFDDIDVHMFCAKVCRDRTAKESPIVQAVTEAANELFEAKPEVLSLWEEIPPVKEGSYQKTGEGSMEFLGTNAISALGVPCCISAFADGDSVAHAPNEFISVEAYIRGVKYIAKAIQNFADLIEKENN